VLGRIDPLVRLILAAMLLAVVLPATGSSTRVAQWISNGAVFLLFFFNGVRLPRHEVMAGLSNHRLLWPLALWSFGAMTLFGWALWQLGAGWMPPALALGLLYLGCLPSTVQSATSCTSLAGGNVASAVVAAALLNLLGIFISAPLFSILAGGADAALNTDGLVKVVGLLLLPFILGQVARDGLKAWAAQRRMLLIRLDRSTIAIAVYVAFSGAVAQQFWERVDLAGWLWLSLGTAIMLLFGHGGAWVLGGLTGLDRGNRITMLFAGAQKSVAMGAPLAAVLFSPAMAGVVLLPLLLYHLVQLIVAAPIATRLSRT
jgi:sodium/bile acid cotransporter 7